MSVEPKTISILQEMLDAELSWRIQELSNFRNSIPREKGVAQKSLIRAGVTLLYAHWEGFIKEASLQYYHFVSYQKHNIEAFNSGFISILLSREVNELLDTKKIKKKLFFLKK
jgi:hypothetical protein